MIDFIKSFFSDDQRKPGDSHSNENLQIAVCAILLEVAQADNHYAAEEQNRLDHLIKTYFKLNDESLSQLKDKADAARKERVDLYYFTKTIRQNYSVEEREGILEMVFQVVYSDGYMDKYEESICRRLTELIGLNHKQYIEIKQKVSHMS